MLSAHDPHELPPPGRPELAFAGRSNAGKSSAINALAGRRRLAFVSKTPGRTQLINFFSLGERAYLVDLPGYGYAGVPGEVREHWQMLVGGYIAERTSLAAVVVVMDIRHPLTPLDRTLLEWLRAARARRARAAHQGRQALRAGRTATRSTACAATSPRSVPPRRCSSSPASSARGSTRPARHSRAWPAEKKKPRLKGSKAGAKNALIGIKAPAQGGEAGKE